MGTFKRSLCVASSNRSRLVVEVELDDAGELHITGDHRNASGMSSGGQIQDSVERIAAEVAREPGGRRHLGEADTSALVEIWRRWHLNHLRPGCEHQQSWDTGKAIEHRTLSVDWDDRRQLQRQAEADPMSPAVNLLAMLERGKVRPFGWVTVTPDFRAKLARFFEIIKPEELRTYRDQAARAAQGLPWEWPLGKRRNRLHGGGYLAGNAKTPLLEQVEHKAAGWVRFDEHPDGLLCKPCDVCGYKYGTEWKHEEIPAAVVAELDRITAGRPEPPPEDEPLTRAGLKFEAVPVSTRPGNLEWAPGSRHYRCTIKRGRRSFSFHYTQGPAHTAPPAFADVFDCLRTDAQLAQDEDNAKELGMKPSQWGQLKRQTQAFVAVVGDAAELLGIPSGRA